MRMEELCRGIYKDIQRHIDIDTGILFSRYAGRRQNLHSSAFSWMGKLRLTGNELGPEAVDILAPQLNLRAKISSCQLLHQLCGIVGSLTVLSALQVPWLNLVSLQRLGLGACRLAAAAKSLAPWLRHAKSLKMANLRRNATRLHPILPVRCTPIKSYKYM